MREHDRKPDTTPEAHRGAPTRANTSNQAPPSSPQALLHLQRTAGNAAVTHLITAQRRVAVESRQDAGSPESLQQVLGSPGKPLAAPLREEMEQRLGSDFSDVRLHDDTAAQRSATALGAHALTSGHHIVAATPDLDKHTLAHELIHVVQQRRGPVAGTDNGTGVRVSDPGDSFERAAEAGATRAMAAHHPGDGHDHGPAGEGRATRHPAVQRKVTLHKTPDAVDLRQAVRDEGRDADDPEALLDFLEQRLMAEVEPVGLNVAEVAAFHSNRDAIKAQLHKWVSVPPRTRGPKSHDDFGSKQQDRHYNNYSDLARALIGWVEAKPERHREGEVADQVKDQSEVELHLEVLLSRIRAWVEGRQGPKWDDVKRELATSGFGHYQHYFDRKLPQDGELHPDVLARLRTGINGDMWQVMGEPEKHTFRDKVIVLHDLMEYFGRHQWWNPPTAGNDTISDQPGQNLTTTEVDPAGYRTKADEDRGQETFTVGNKTSTASSTRREAADSTKLARRYRIPVWAGSSFTAMRMLNLAHHVGGTLEELSAVAWGVFAFWRLDYDQGVELAYHTLHEVMDIAQNFGVPYTLFQRELDLARHAPGETKKRLVDKSDQAAAALGQADLHVDQMTQWLTANPLSDAADHQAMSHLLQQFTDEITALETALADVTNDVTDLVATIPDQPGPAERARMRPTILRLSHVAGAIDNLFNRLATFNHPADVQAALTLRGIGAAPVR